MGRRMGGGIPGAAADPGASTETPPVPQAPCFSLGGGSHVKDTAPTAPLRLREAAACARQRS